MLCLMSHGTLMDSINFARAAVGVMGIKESGQHLDMLSCAAHAHIHLQPGSAIPAHHIAHLACADAANGDITSGWLRYAVALRSSHSTHDAASQFSKLKLADARPQQPLQSPLLVYSLGGRFR